CLPLRPGSSWRHFGRPRTRTLDLSEQKKSPRSMRDVMKSIAEAATALPLNGRGRPSGRWAGPQPEREGDEPEKDRETHDWCGEPLEEGDVGEEYDDEGRHAGIHAPEDHVVRPRKRRRAVSSESDEEREVQVRHDADKERVVESDRD